MKRLLVAAALAPLTFAAAQASAQTTPPDISTTVYAPISTSSNGGSIVIDSGAGVTPLTGGVSTGNSVGGSSAAQAAAVTLNTGGDTVANAGTISYNAGALGAGTPANVSYLNDNYATGILVNSGMLGGVANTGTISLTETTNYTDTNSDGIVDSNNGVLGQYAVGTNRFGIQTTNAGTFFGGISNAGTITIIGENSAGILVGTGGMSGQLNNSGTIAITGGNMNTNDVSFGIDAKGYVGSFYNEGGSISALGQNAIGVNLAGGTNIITVNTVTSSGTTSVTSTGAVEIYGSITATGYRSTTAPTAPSLLTAVQAQASSELLQGGPALAIGGNVYGGISLDAAIAATGSTAAVVGATVTSDGRAPALLIGSATNTINIGGFSNASGPTGYGLIIGGVVTGAGLYSMDAAGNPIGANGVQIGVGYINNTTGIMSTSGSQLVTVTGGLDITGSVLGVGIANLTSGQGGAVTAIELGNVAIAKPQSTNGYGSTLNISGIVSASSSATVPVNVTAIQIDKGAQTQVPSLYNTGTIEANIGGIAGVLNAPAEGGTSGNAVAIRDSSGSLTSVTNSNVITAAITPINPDTPLAAGSRTIAIDLSANTTTATVNQVSDSGLLGTTSAGVTTTVVPSITGDVLFGSGSGVLNLAAGTLTGGMLFGSGPDNAINITNGAIAIGALAEDQHGELAINVANGVLSIAAPVTVSNHNSSLAAFGSAGQIGLSSLSVGAKGQLDLAVNPDANNNATPQLKVASTGSVTFATGAQLGLNFTSKLDLTSPTQGVTFTLIEAANGKISAGGLNGVSNGGTGPTLGSIPYLYQGTVTVGAYDAGDQAISVTVQRKSAQQLGLNAAQASAYNAIYSNFDVDEATLPAGAIGSVASAMLSADNRTDFLRLYNQFLPDYSGGPFEDMVMGQQALSRAEEEAPEKLEADSSRGWVQEIGYYNSRSDSSSINGYEGKGFGVAGGFDRALGAQSSIGLAGAFLSSSITDLGRPTGSSQDSNALELGAYWRTNLDGFNIGANVNGGWSFLESRRVLSEEEGTDANGSPETSLYRMAKANWMGGIASGSFSVSYKASFGRYYVKPELLADYVMLYEQGYTEHGGGDAFDLTVNSKLNKEAIVQTDAVFGATYGTATKWSPELTVGWREVVAGGPADTTASFAGGTPFKMAPDYQEKGGMMARIGVRASGNFADFSANAGGLFRPGYETLDARATARFLF